jgi:Tfp pilus assembly protein PilF
MKKIIILSIIFVLICAFFISVQTTDEKAAAALRKGNNAGQNNDVSTAIINFTKAIEIDPKYANAYYNRGGVYKALGKTKEANADFAKIK